MEVDRWWGRRPAQVGLSVVALTIVLLIAYFAVHRTSSHSIPAETRATQTLTRLGTPVATAIAQPPTSYHWPSCEQGDCYNEARAYRLTTPMTLGEASTALDAWAVAQGLEDGAVPDCVSSTQQRLLPEEHGCYQVWRVPGQGGQVVTVWAHFANPAAETGDSEQVRAPAWQHFGHQQVTELVVDVVDVDPLPD